jgi:DNA-binding NtrC family response regulator
MSNQWDALVASSETEIRADLVSVLRQLLVRVISCSDLLHAQQIISREGVSLVFCDESLSDGSFRELLAGVKREKVTPKVVVAIRTGEWKEYLEAMRLGAFDAIRWPLRESEIETVVAHAMREHRVFTHHDECLGEAEAR